MPGAFLWDERVARAVGLSALGAQPVASMPLSNLLDPQPRHRTRWLDTAATVLVDFGTPAAIDAVALLSTTLRFADAFRVRIGAAADMASGVTYDSTTVGCETDDAAPGNVVLVLPATASGRYLMVNMIAPGVVLIDVGRLVAGPLWRISRAVAYGVQEGREVLDRRDRNPLTGAEFPVPALANPRLARFTLPLLSATEGRTQHRALLAALGGAGEALWIPETSLSLAELNARSIWGAVAAPGEEALATRDSPAGTSRSFRIVERV